MSPLKKAFSAITFLFICMAAVLAWMIKTGFDNAQPIMDERYYEIGMDYQKVIDKYKKAESEGWQLKEAPFSSAGKAGEMTLNLQAVTAQKVKVSNDALCRLQLGRPADSLQDQTFTAAIKAATSADGQTTAACTLKVTLPASGFWESRLYMQFNTESTLYTFKKFEAMP